MDSATRRMLPPDPEEMNERRVQWAGEALTFFEVHGEDPDDATTEEERRTLLEQNLSDLIADFAHFCESERAGNEQHSADGNGTLLRGDRRRRRSI